MTVGVVVSLGRSCQQTTELPSQPRHLRCLQDTGSQVSRLQSYPRNLRLHLVTQETPLSPVIAVTPSPEPDPVTPESPLSPVTAVTLSPENADRVTGVTGDRSDLPVTGVGGTCPHGAQDPPNCYLCKSADYRATLATLSLSGHSLAILYRQQTTELPSQPGTPPFAGLRSPSQQTTELPSQLEQAIRAYCRGRVSRQQSYPRNFSPFPGRGFSL